MLGGMKTSDIVKSVVGFLCLGKNDFDAIEPFRQDCFLREALDISKVPDADELQRCSVDVHDSIGPNPKFWKKA